MEQIKELLNILSETPEMALWGMGLYFLFILIKAASWIGALTLVAKQFITRLFDWKDKSSEVKLKEIETSDANKLLEELDKHCITGVGRNGVIHLFRAMKRKGFHYVFEDDIALTIKLIKENRRNQAK